MHRLDGLNPWRNIFSKLPPAPGSDAQQAKGKSMVEEISKKSLKVSRFIRLSSALIRAIPINRAKGFFVGRSLIFRRYRMDFSFKCRRIGVNWSASAFPDLMTRHMLFEGIYQEDVLLALKNTISAGCVVFDVGGHHGLMAIISSRSAGKNGKVVSFEPNPYSRCHLEKHLAMNGADNVRIEPLVLSDEDGYSDFYVQTGLVTWNSSIMKEFVERTYSEVMKVRSVTLDGYVSESGLVPDVIKIDTEGSEFKILNGAVHTIDSYKPIIIMEFNEISARAAGRKLSEYIRFLENKSYSLFVLKRNVLGHFHYHIREPFREVDHCKDDVANVICIPSAHFN